MLEKSLIRVFLVCLVSCASLVLSFIWGGEPADVFVKIAVTLFIIGLGCFLSWFVCVLTQLRATLTAHS